MDCYVCGETGPTHIAAAVGTFTVCLYTSRCDPIYTGPQGTNHVILFSEGEDL